MRATTRRARGTDVLAWFDPSGTAFLNDEIAIATSGVAALVAPEDAVKVLRDIDYRVPRGVDHPAIGPIAMGALHFDGHGDLVIPARCAVRSAGQMWVTEIEPAAVAARAPVAGGRHARRFTVESVQDLGRWDAMVTAGLGLIANRTLRKVVLAREVIVDADVAFDTAAILDRLRATQPACTVYADRGFIGASPELLIRRRDRDVTARPMAGTTPRRESVAADQTSRDELARSKKNIEEHRLVVDDLIELLRGPCDDVVAGEPALVSLTSVTHLTTMINARLRDAEVTALDLALAVHPTPAVGGTPTDRALEAIRAIEGFDRGHYGAPMGWVNAHGDGEFVVALRCAQLDGRRARLLAGAGIVADSDPDSEWIETQAKLEPMLRALVRP